MRWTLWIIKLVVRIKIQICFFWTKKGKENEIKWYWWLGIELRSKQIVKWSCHFNDVEHLFEYVLRKNMNWMRDEELKRGAVTGGIIWSLGSILGDKVYFVLKLRIQPKVISNNFEWKRTMTHFNTVSQSRISCFWTKILPVENMIVIKPSTYNCCD